MADSNDAARLDRVETEVSTIRSEMGALTREVGSVKADVKGLGSILTRIEQGVSRAQEKNEEREERSKPNLVAVVSVLITLISIIVGGAWLISGQLARMDERSQWMQRVLWADHEKGEQRGFERQKERVE